MFEWWIRAKFQYRVEEIGFDTSSIVLKIFTFRPFHVKQEESVSIVLRFVYKLGMGVPWQKL